MEQAQADFRRNFNGVRQDGGGCSAFPRNSEHREQPRELAKSYLREGDRHIGISKRGYHGDLTANQIGRQRGRLSPALKVTETSSQTAEKRGQVTFRDETG